MDTPMEFEAVVGNVYQVKSREHGDYRCIATCLGTNELSSQAVAEMLAERLNLFYHGL